MPTATLIRCATSWRGGSTSYPSSVVAAVPIDGGISSSSSSSSNHEVNHPIIPEMHGAKGRSVIKNSQTDVKVSIRTRQKCSHEGCTNIAQKGGVCITHGAKVIQCSISGSVHESLGGQCSGCIHGSFEGCTKYPQGTEGVCITHGAKVKQCNFDGCTSNAKKGGVCITHGAKVKRKRCSHKGCNNWAVKGGVCITHGAKVKQCSFDGCTNQALKGGVCITHGATRKQCSFEGCTNKVKKGGVCYRHRSKSTIISTNNPTLEANIALPSSVPPSHQSTDYEDEEELNSWIWKSSRIPRKLG
jgi:hypothetical protein